jgi:hypothetical protein
MAENSSPNSDTFKQTRPKARTKSAVTPKEPSFMDKFKASITGPPTAAAKAASDSFHANVGKSEGAADQRIKDAMNAGIGSLGGATANADMYADNLKRYNEYMKSQGQPVGGPSANDPFANKGYSHTMPQRPATPEITPEMREAALGMFESQQGAGQVPYYMAAARDDVNYRQGGNRDDFVSYRQGGNRDDFGVPIVGGPPPQNPNMSPAFQYAAQNYDVLGGSQRLAPRPMEMMSVAERNRINDMSQAMADQAAQQQMAQNEYQQGLTAGKGGPRTMPQPGVSPTQPTMPQYGGGLAAILAKRFGNMA